MSMVDFPTMIARRPRHGHQPHPAGFLDAATERGFIEAAKDGDPLAIAHLVENSRYYIDRIARRLLKRNLVKIPLSDACQEGALGVMRAVDEYDLGSKVRLISYAKTWIRKYILDANYNYMGIRVPQYMIFPGKAQKLDPEFHRRSLMALACRDATSLSARQGSVANPRPWEGVFGEAAHRGFEAIERSDEVVDAAGRACVLLSHLDLKSQRVMRMRYGIGSCSQSPMTMRAVGRELGVSAAQVADIEKRALMAMRQLPEGA